MGKRTVAGALISLLTGCGEKPAPPKAAAAAPPPDKPGVSLAITYPMMIIDSPRVRIKPDEDSLITTRVADGGNYYRACDLIDAAGIEYDVTGVWEFGRKSAWLDMGTTPYQVYLGLRVKGPIALEKVKQMVLDALLKPYQDQPDPDVTRRMKTRIGAANSFAALMEASKDNFARD